ncbi:ROK family transcriptional regulator [Aeromicrobium wangtongii]|uniref:ROK family transcriptional regulator n=1 Tax=Aeromicrobium wangtongii TaxID=2969247 RepID=UPI0020173B18|nr:ROK family transcriptional regulator [Aeromicrobium wangtongii]MCL3818135.1 ROK family protein [Aeromicrobium wangtongii]
MNAPGSLETLRRRNRGLVLRAVQSGNATSRVDIVRATGLSRTTVSSLVNELLAEGVLSESTDRGGVPPAGQTGRPPTRLTLEPSGGAVLGIHLRHDGIRLALADLAGTVLAETLVDLDVDHRADAALSFVGDATSELLDLAGTARAELLGAGVAISSPVPTLPHHGPGMLATWHDIDVADAVGQRLGVPVQVGNDANLGATAERFFGAARTTRNLVYVMLAEGVGAGLFLDGRPYFGARGVAGEFGHVVVAPGGRVCRCGNRGCLETVAGAGALVSAMPVRPGGQAAELDDVLAACRAGDPGALRLVTDAGRAVGTALAGVCTMLDPDLVVIGGRTAAAGAALLDGIGETLRRGVPPTDEAPVPVVAGELGARAEVLGAVALAIAGAPLSAAHDGLEAIDPPPRYRRMSTT